MADNKPPHLRFLLLSKTSYDKRCTANTILCQQHFDVRKVITKPEERSVNFTKYGQKISLLDTPGLMDSGVTAKQVFDNIQYQLRGDQEGFNAVLLVFRHPTRMTPEEKDSIQWIKDLIGADVMQKHGIVVFTNGKSFSKPSHKTPRTNFKEYIDSERKSLDKDSFGSFLNLMPDRYIFLDNDSEIHEGNNDREIKYLLHLSNRNNETVSFYRASLVASNWFVSSLCTLVHAIPGLQGLLDRAYKWWFSIPSTEVYVDEASYDHLEDIQWDKPGLTMMEGGEELLRSEIQVNEKLDSKTNVEQVARTKTADPVPEASEAKIKAGVIGTTVSQSVDDSLKGNFQPHAGKTEVSGRSATTKAIDQTETKTKEITTVEANTVADMAYKITEDYASETKSQSEILPEPLAEVSGMTGATNTSDVEYEANTEAIPTESEIVGDTGFMAKEENVILVGEAKSEENKLPLHEPDEEKLDLCTTATVDNIIVSETTAEEIPVSLSKSGDGIQCMEDKPNTTKSEAKAVTDLPVLGDFAEAEG